jgi:hypothetical protein
MKGICSCSQGSASQYQANYSVNRLNVSITRARCKSIVCLPRPLLNGMPRVLESPDAARGLAFMQNIVRELEKQGRDVRV